MPCAGTVRPRFAMSYKMYYLYTIPLEDGIGCCMNERKDHGCVAGEELKPEIPVDEDIVMTDEHWRILWFMREFRINHRIPASLDDVLRFIGQDLAYGERARSRLFELFPHAHVLYVCKANSDFE